MNLELVQTVALAAHGSAWLARGDGTPPPEVTASNSAFRFTRDVTFVGPTPSSPVAHSAGQWLEGLRERGVERVWIVLNDARRGIVPEHNAVAFAGGGTWALLATAHAGDEAWQPDWQLGDQHAPDQRIWDFRVDGTPLADPVAPPRPPIDAATDDLVHALTAIRAFSAEQRLHGWTELFDQALAVRDAPDPVELFVSDLFPDSHPAAARRLAAMAAHAWVFGGMGSWNDLGFEAPDVTNRYDELSRSLYTAVLTATVAATNVELGRV